MTMEETNWERPPPSGRRDRFEYTGAHGRTWIARRPPVLEKGGYACC
jgi:hypothetical protein